MTLFDIAELNGTFTEGNLIEHGFPIEVIREAISIGLLRPNRMGILETIKREFRPGKLEASLGEDLGAELLKAKGIAHRCAKCDLGFRTPFTLHMHDYYEHGPGKKRKKKKKISEAYAPGQNVFKTIDGVAIPFQVKEVNGNMCTLLSTDGKNQTIQVSASDPDLALAPMTDDEKRAAQQANQKIQNAPSAPAPAGAPQAGTGGMTSTNQSSSAMG